MTTFKKSVRKSGKGTFYFHGKAYNSVNNKSAIRTKKFFKDFQIHMYPL